MTDDSDSANGSTPGGGPNRVVSETNVDDILDSIDTASESDRDDRAEESEQNEATDRTEGTARDEESGQNERANSIERENERDSEFEPDAIPDPKPNSTTIETGQPADPAAVLADADSSAGRVTENAPEDEGTSDEEPLVEPIHETESERTAETENALEDTDPDLSSRIDRGEVTGSDVRAAEAGEGREETTDIGDIELSMDDLESTTGSGSSSSATRGRSSTDGPLSGSIGPSTDDPETSESNETNDSETDGAPTGLFDRLKGLFSR